ncbi:MAG: restriction endonuclease subunit S [Actinomycetota bacterium]|nr:restriction endonuclease subunit S [Actinomycetota bacterium]
MHAYLSVFDRSTFVEGATRPKLTQESMNTIPVPVPPRSEQKSIADQVLSFTSETDRLTGLLTTQLTLLAEYREALITAAVTGEIDVDTFDRDRNVKTATP